MIWTKIFNFWKKQRACTFAILPSRKSWRQLPEPNSTFFFKWFQGWLDLIIRGIGANHPSPNHPSPFGLRKSDEKGGWLAPIPLIFLFDFRCGSPGTYADVNVFTCVLRFASIDAKINCSRVHFEVGDACNLRPNLHKVDLIFGGNLLCRLPKPLLFLDRAYSLLRKGGILVLTTPCSWLEQWTDKSNWLGGYVDESGKEVLTSEGIDRALKGRFQLLERGKMPFMIREHSRKFQWGLADYHVFKKTELKANL